MYALRTQEFPDVPTHDRCHIVYRKVLIRPLLPQIHSNLLKYYRITHLPRENILKFLYATGLTLKHNVFFFLTDTIEYLDHDIIPGLKKNSKTYCAILETISARLFWLVS